MCFNAGCMLGGRDCLILNLILRCYINSWVVEVLNQPLHCIFHIKGSGEDGYRFRTLFRSPHFNQSSHNFVSRCWTDIHRMMICMIRSTSHGLKEKLMRSIIPVATTVMV
jgi:hypothetical protein